MNPWLDDGDLRLYHGDALETVRQLPDESVDCVVTSPPYWGLRDYGTGEWDGGNPDCDHQTPKQPDRKFTNGRGENTGYAGTNLKSWTDRDGTTYKDVCGKCGARRVDRQMGLEPTPDLFVQNMVELFREIRRVLAPHGTCWVNMGTSYASGQSLQPRRAPAYGNGDTTPQGSPATGSVYPDLCDECRDATRNRRDRTDDSSQPLELDALLHETTDRDSGPADSGPVASGVAPRAVQASTNQRSSEPPPGGCSHCANCGACLAVLRSSTRDARLCVRTESNTNGTTSMSPSSADRTSDTEPSALAYLYSTIASRRLKQKDDTLMPQLLALALQLDGWYVRSEIIWAKKNCMPESVTDRPTKSHETIWLLTKQPRYWFDTEAVREPPTENPGGAAFYARKGQPMPEYERRLGKAGQPNRGGSDDAGNDGLVGRVPSMNGRNVRSVWQIATQPYPEAHFATFPEELARRCILAGCPTRVCRVCGKPSERIVERESVSRPDLPKDHPEWRPSRYDNGKAGDPQAPGPGQRFSNVETVGWSDCECRTVHQTDVTRVVMANVDKWRPGVVLDPFIGSGTTAKVARDHQRHAIGIDLNQTYLELAARRLQQLSLLNAP